jgi:hypothetical protein
VSELQARWDVPAVNGSLLSKPRCDFAHDKAGRGGDDSHRRWAINETIVLAAGSLVR